MAIKILSAAAVELDQSFVHEVSYRILQVYQDLCADDSKFENQNATYKYDFILDQIDARGPSSAASLVNLAIKQHGYDKVRKFLVKNFPL